MNSKMFRVRNNNRLMVDGLYLLNCQHRTYNMYYQCPNSDHLHCIRCGKILSRTLPGKIYKSHVSCEHLINHLSDFNLLI